VNGVLLVGHHVDALGGEEGEMTMTFDNCGGTSFTLPSPSASFLLSPQSQLGKMCFLGNVYVLLLIASGARRLQG